MQILNIITNAPSMWQAQSSRAARRIESTLSVDAGHNLKGTLHHITAGLPDRLHSGHVAPIAAVALHLFMLLQKQPQRSMHVPPHLSLHLCIVVRLLLRCYSNTALSTGHRLLLPSTP